MESFSKNTYEHTIRWDMASRFTFKTSFDIPTLNQISIRMHETHPKNYKDRFVLALFLELISGQRVANRLILKGKYKKSLTVKHNSEAIQLATTLRGNNLYIFTDKWLLYGLLKASTLSQFKNLEFSKKGTVSFYYNDALQFQETHKLFSIVHKIGGLQIHYKSSSTDPILLRYLLNSWRIPLDTEGLVDSKCLPSYNFFNKLT